MVSDSVLRKTVRFTDAYLFDQIHCDHFGKQLLDNVTSAHSAGEDSK